MKKTILIVVLVSSLCFQAHASVSRAACIAGCIAIEAAGSLLCMAGYAAHVAICTRDLVLSGSQTFEDCLDRASDGFDSCLNEVFIDKQICEASCPDE